MLWFFLDGPLFFIGIDIYPYDAIPFVLSIIDQSGIKGIDEQALAIETRT